MINPALEQICATEEYAKLVCEKALLYMTIAKAQLRDCDSDADRHEMISKVMFTLFACGFGEGVKAAGVKRN